jgi:hypothetical protein
MTIKYVFLIPAALLILSTGLVKAGQTTNEAGAIVCVNDKWDEKEVGKGHKLVDAVQRCVIVPNDPSGTKFIEDCVGKYEYLPDQSWKGSGTCTDNIGKDKRYDSWGGRFAPEGIHVQITGGTGKWEGASGGGTYVYENLSDTIAAGTYKGQIVLP